MMRWLFLLLLVLNGVYFVWHQQQAPLKVKEVTSTSLYKGTQREIQLLREMNKTPVARRPDECMIVGGFIQPARVEALRQRLLSLDVASTRVAGQVPGADGLWLKIEPQSERLLDSAVLTSLSMDFNDLKHKIILCRGIATAE